MSQEPIDAANNPKAAAGALLDQLDLNEDLIRYPTKLCVRMRSSTTCACSPIGVYRLWGHGPHVRSDGSRLRVPAEYAEGVIGGSGGDLIMRRTFACGHRGKGRYCHRCEQEKLAEERLQAEYERKTRRSEARQQLFDHDSVDLRGLPPVVVKGARRLLNKLRQGGNWLELGGRKLMTKRQLVRFPLPCEYRLVCELTDDGLVPLVACSHEAYNKKWRRI